MNTFNSYNNKNYLLVRNHKYEVSGRFQNEEQAKDVREHIISKLNDLELPYEILTSSWEDCEKIANEIVKEIENEQ